MPKEADSLKTKFSTAKWAVKALFSLAKLDFILLVIFSVFSGLLPTVQVYFYSRIINDVVSVITTPPLNLFGSEVFRSTIFLIIITATIDLVIAFLRDQTQAIKFRYSLRHLKFFEVEVARKSEDFSLYEYEDTEISDKIYRATQNIYKLKMFLWDLITTFTDAVNIIIIAAVVISFSPILFAFLVIAAIPSAVLYNKYIIDSWDFYNSNTDTFRTRNFVFGHLENVDNFLENKVSGGLQYVITFLKKLVNRLSEDEYAIQSKWVRSSMVTALIDFFKDIFLQIFILLKIISTGLTIGDFTFHNSRALAFRIRLSNFFNGITSLQTNLMAIEQLRELLEIKPKMKSGRKILETKNIPKIEFRDVSFKYPGAKKFALKNISMIINPGDEIAIVGKNGSGKTTLIKLLLRFYDPTSGKILIDGVPLKEIDLQSYYKYFGALFQEYITYFFLTLRENVTIGKGGKYSKIQAEEAEKLAEIYEKIMKLPLKDKHTVVKTFKNGTNLSRGERQKLALARMFYRNSPILILDEPTASIDAEAEYKIFNRIYDFIEDKTVLIISHRFSTVRNAQRIYVLEGGEIKEQGTHKDLMDKGGEYAKTFELQAKGYFS